MWNNTPAKQKHPPPQKKKKVFFIMTNLHPHYHFKLDFQKVEQHTGGKWKIHGPKRRKNNQLQSLERSCRIP